MQRTSEGFPNTTNLVPPLLDLINPDLHTTSSVHPPWLTGQGRVKELRMGYGSIRFRLTYNNKGARFKWPLSLPNLAW
jgi:hypothetical protein